MPNMIHAGGVTAGSQVKTARGYVCIYEVKDDDLLWDGQEWVRHDGVVYIGTKPWVEHGNIIGTNGLLIYTSVRKEPILLEAVKLYDLDMLVVDEGVRRRPAPDKGKAVPMYQILNAGPRHRFTCQGYLIHNHTV